MSQSAVQLIPNRRMTRRFSKFPEERALGHSRLRNKIGERKRFKNGLFDPGDRARQSILPTLSARFISLRRKVSNDQPSPSVTQDRTFELRALAQSFNRRGVGQERRQSRFLQVNPVGVGTVLQGKRSHTEECMKTRKDAHFRFETANKGLADKNVDDRERFGLNIGMSTTRVEDEDVSAPHAMGLPFGHMDRLALLDDDDLEKSVTMAVFGLLTLHAVGRDFIAGVRRKEFQGVSRDHS